MGSVSSLLHQPQPTDRGAANDAGSEGRLYATFNRLAAAGFRLEVTVLAWIDVGMPAVHGVAVSIVDERMAA